MGLRFQHSSRSVSTGSLPPVRIGIAPTSRRSALAVPRMKPRAADIGYTIKWRALKGGDKIFDKLCKAFRIRKQKWNVISVALRHRVDLAPVWLHLYLPSEIRDQARMQSVDGIRLIRHLLSVAILNTLQACSIYITGAASHRRPCLLILLRPAILRPWLGH